MALAFQPNEALFRSSMVDRLVDIAIEEDLGHGDCTTEALGIAGRSAANVVAKEALVCCGGPLIERLVHRAGFKLGVRRLIPEGSLVAEGDPLLRLEGPTSALLALEQLVLNLVGRQVAVATMARRYVDAVAGTRTRLVDTRQTLPGWRQLDRYAVGVGGASNHRYDLGSGVLIRSTHILSSASVSGAVERARKWAPHTLRVGVEVTGLAQLYEALEAGAEYIVLAGLSAEQAREAVERVEGRALVEVAGDVNPEQARSYAEAGVDFISVSALTAEVALAKLGFRLEQLPTTSGN